ncbi:GNAT family N-acetyltransferase [Streptomyces sp. NPDC059063]|uniref:GNAT family N-acetyltransferase n=1 Tax=unclassified Streptomyces TaxID=2593676 RepID=UPI0036AAA5D5
MRETHETRETRLREARPDDHARVVAAVRTWWTDRSPAEMRELSLLLPKLFLQFFARTSLVREDETGIRAFLVGFHPADLPDEAYIHFVGVDPALRGRGVGRELYEAFFRGAADAGRTRVRAVTSPTNTGSIAFHRSMGFGIETGDAVGPGGVSVHTGYDGPGLDRVCFLRRLQAGRKQTVTGD